MGYYTDYECEFSGIVENGYDFDDIILAFPTITGYGSDGGSFDINHGDTLSLYLSNVTWYEYDADLRNLTTMFAGVRVAVSGYGEERGDLWCGVFKGGKGRIERFHFLPDISDDELE